MLCLPFPRRGLKPTGMETSPKDRASLALPGAVLFVPFGVVLWLLYCAMGGAEFRPGLIFLAVFVFIMSMRSCAVISPNESLVLTFLGNYVGTVTRNGFSLINPLANRRRVTLRMRNFQSPQLKVNDAQGNPVEIAAVVVWQVERPADAVFEVDDYEAFMPIQCETALRQVATHYPYEPHTADEVALRSHPVEVSKNLCEEIQKRVSIAGIRVTEASLSHLAYSPEIAQAMLRRQQAQAVIAARQMIVEGAVGMVEMALTKLEKDGVVKLDEHGRATMVNNLMLALVSEHHVQPVMSAGQPKA